MTAFFRFDSTSYYYYTIELYFFYIRVLVSSYAIFRMDRTLRSCPIVSFIAHGDSWSSWSRHTPWGGARGVDETGAVNAMGPKAPDADRGGPTHGVLPPLSWKGEARAPAPDLAGSHRKFLQRSSLQCRCRFTCQCAGCGHW